MQISQRNIIVCGMPAEQIQIRNQVLDVSTFADPLGRMDDGITAEFRFTLWRNDDFDRFQQRFQVGSGSFQRHSLGPADVCEYCGTAWLPGTVRCPSCGGSTSWQHRAIEYAARNTGVIAEKIITASMSGPVIATVKVRFDDLALTPNNIHEMFRHDLWHNDPALWVCAYCGHMVHGYTAKCPGCGGSRQRISDLATQRRTCIWCGKHTTGGYACPACNMRLKAN